MIRKLARREFLTRVATGAVAMGVRQAEQLSFLPQDRLPGFRGLVRGQKAGESCDVEGVTLQWCPPGRFVMGSPASEVGRRDDEAQVNVSLTRGFWIAKYEATQGQWRRIVGAFPDKLPSAEWGEGDALPVYWVNHAEAEDFCRRLTVRARASGALPEAWAFRLPTEAQWEYACRAGTTTAMAFGDVLDLRHANFLGDTGDVREPPLKRAVRVGSYPSNAWGICDMHGNVFEWCRDWYYARLPGGVDPDPYDVKGVQNRDGSYSRVRRGGAWNDPAWACRSALRLRYEPERRADHIGFRVVAVEAAGYK